MAMEENFKFYVFYDFGKSFYIPTCCRISDFTIGWKMQEIGQLVEVDFGGPLSLYGLVRMRKK
jgi:hypothetical protein